MTQHSAGRIKSVYLKLRYPKTTRLRAESKTQKQGLFTTRNALGENGWNAQTRKYRDKLAQSTQTKNTRERGITRDK